VGILGGMDPFPRDRHPDAHRFQTKEMVVGPFTPW
jgi:hypothetical protein